MGDEIESSIDPDLISKLESQDQDWLQAAGVNSSNSIENFDYNSAVEAAIQGEEDGEGQDAVAVDEFALGDYGGTDEVVGVDDGFGHEGAVLCEGEEGYGAVQVAAGSPRQMAVGVPHTGVTAEIVLVMTSFGGVRRPYFSSKRARHLLDCKGVVYYVIDINNDFSEASGLKDRELYDQWRAGGRLKKSEREVTVEDDGGVNTSVQIPQVLIDGYPIGDETNLQDLEEDGDLDWICARAACPACLNEKDPSETTCPACKLALESIVPEDLVYSGQIQQLYKGQNYGALGEGEVFEHPTFKTGGTLGHQGSANENFTYEDLFGEAPADE
eukprot:GHVN01028572.1.p1 GENE.GHVN01028572.1~~GHVN01028572.1.p1  ORF type:complete len:328 (+),score=67.00 GHVN01028572.1:301-1284(+)